MKRVYFVDDDELLLKSLERSILLQNPEWEPKFIANGPDAITTMKETPPDILVTDIQMPEMSGVELMKEVIVEHPQILRIVLSGETGAEKSLEALNLADEFLLKPCKPESIITAIDRLFDIQERWASPALLKLLTKDRPLPSTPGVYKSLKLELESESSSAQSIGAVISHDPSLSVKILHLANSAFFGATEQKVTSIADAVNRLGEEFISDLVLSWGVLSNSSSIALPELPFDTMWERSLKTAGTAKEVARMEGADDKVLGETFLAGLLHGVGQMVLAFQRTEDYRAILSKSKESKKPVWELEQEAFGFSHGDVGGYLCGIWGFADPILEGVSNYYRPGNSNCKAFSSLAAVHFATGLSHGEFDESYFKGAGLEDSFKKWKQAFS